MILTTSLLASLVSLALATQISPQVLHERRSSIPNGWTKRSRHTLDAVLPLRFGLTQSNIDQLENFILDVSDPQSPNYAQHWTPARIAKTFAPSEETVDIVSKWLHASGIHPDRIRVTSGKAYLELKYVTPQSVSAFQFLILPHSATVAEAERLLSAQYNIYDHPSGASHVACEEYHVPAHVSKHIDLITPSVHFDRRLVGRDAPGKPKATGIGAPGFGTVVPKTVGTIKNLVDELKNCDTHITPICLRALYGLVYEPLAASKNSYGIVEYTPQAYLQSDLDLFYKNFSSSLVGLKPKVVSIDGGVAQTEMQGFEYNGESDLDIEYGQVLVGKKLPITLYQVGDLVQGASFNNFLDAIDGSYWLVSSVS
jgi:tripeptidyl-peptidase-1